MKIITTVLRFGSETAQPRVSAFCDETREESTKLGLLLEQVGSHETRTKELRCLVKYLPSNRRFTFKPEVNVARTKQPAFHGHFRSYSQRAPH